MASIGLKGLRYNIIDPQTKKYKALANKKVPILEGAIDSKTALNFTDATLYADDSLAEECHEFTNGTLTLGIKDDDDTVFAELLGHTKSEGGEVIRKKDDEAPYVGIGRVVTKIVNGSKKYKVEFLPKVKFKPFIPDSKTKGESLEFSTASVEGTIFALDESINGMGVGEYERHQTFDSESKAIAYLEKLLTPIS